MQVEHRSRNRRNNHRLEINGRIKTMIEWSEESGVALGTIWNRVKLGWNTRDAVFKPVRERKLYPCQRDRRHKHGAGNEIF